ncbi:polysaccharide biosynthesis protein [Eubacterium limosum]|nr:polysaccharide biosynthesis protein [Eubacterium limosum]
MYIKKNLILFTFIITTFFCMCFLLCNVTLKSNLNNIPNLLIFIFSLLIFIASLFSIVGTGLQTYNLFAFTFFLFLCLNTFNLSLLQIEKTFMDIYYYFFGSVVFILCLYLGEKVLLNKNKKIKIKVKGFFEPNKMVVILLILYFLIQFIIYTKVGFAFLSMENNLRFLDRSAYRIQGLSGIVSIVKWILLMFIPVIKRKRKLLVIISLIVFDGILSVSRGDISRVILYLIILWISNLWTNKKTINKKEMIKKSLIGLAFIILFLIIFSILGNIRQGIGDYSFSITKLSQGRVNSDIVNWLYTYTSINFDVLLKYKNFIPINFAVQLFLPLFRLFGQNNLVDHYLSIADNISISGFNACTFIGTAIVDFGALYFVELGIMGLSIGIFMRLIKNSTRFIGIKNFVYLMISLLIFGNYIFSPNYFYSILGAYVLLCLCKTKER